MKTEDIVIRKWHEENGTYLECTLKELWKNGFDNGQMFQKANQHTCHIKDREKGNFYVKPEWLDNEWKAFWYDLKDAEVIVNERSESCV